VAEEIKKETEPVVEKPVEPVVEKVVEKPDIDKEAIAEIMRGQKERDAKLENIAKDVEQSKGAQEKLDQMTQVLTGETKENKADKIFREFADDPETTLAKYGEGKSKAELAEIKGILEEMKFEKADNSAMQRISSSDPEYDLVMGNISKFTTEEEQKRYASDSSRFEILYGITKSRMAGQIAESKVSADKAKTDAINKSNKGAVSEKPGGKEVEEPTDSDKREKAIADARHNFDPDKTAKLAVERLLEDSDFLKKWELDE